MSRQENWQTHRSWNTPAGGEALGDVGVSRFRPRGRVWTNPGDPRFVPQRPTERSVGDDHDHLRRRRHARHDNPNSANTSDDDIGSGNGV